MYVNVIVGYCYIMWNRNLFSIVFCLHLVNVINCDLFNAISDLESLLANEQKTVALLENYVENEMKKILELKKWWYNFFSSWNSNYIYLLRLIRHVSDYANIVNEGLSLGVDNPVYFYLLLKNLSRTWKNIEIFNKPSQASEGNV